MRVRVRGIYTTALTHRLVDADHEVVQASEPIRARFDESLPAVPYDAAVDTTSERQGVGVVGDPDAVAAVGAVCEDGVDTLAWDAPLPRGAVFDGEVVDTSGPGAVVDCGVGEGFLPYGEVNGYVDEGDRYRVQVADPAPPWGRDRPRLSTDLRVEGGLVTLSRARSGVSANVRGERATELVRLTDLVPVEAPDGWGVRWQRAAASAGMDALREALERAVERADALDALDSAVEEPRTLATPEATRWIWFGRESRFALDADRRAVETTMHGHHRIKAGDPTASSAVDFAEAVCTPDDDGAFPFDVVTRQFGPVEGDSLAIGHGKPDGRLIVLGTGRVTDYDPDGRVTIRREMTGGGTYDALGTPREAGDVAVTKLKEGRWWYPTVYRSDDGEKKGTYVNVCTPVEIFPDAARYVDLHVDVVKDPDGTVRRVDDDELDDAVAAGNVSEALAERARTVATTLERALGE